jgi:hypothetical protein
MMTDEQVRKLVDLLGLYIEDSLAEGMSLTDVGDRQTTRMILQDCVGTLPAYHTIDLPESVRSLTDE